MTTFLKAVLQRAVKINILNTMTGDKYNRKPALYVSISSKTRYMRVPRKRLFALCEYISRNSERHIHDVDIAVVDSTEISACNKRYLGSIGPTDVISFDLAERPDRPLSAQLIVCGQVAVKEAAGRRHGVQRELMLYVVHGLLHLLGYDDRKPSDAAEMYLKQEHMLDDFLREYRSTMKQSRGKG